MRVLMILSACFLIMAVFAVNATNAAERTVPQSRQQIQLSYSPLVKKAAPTVVNIYASRVVTTRALVSPFMNDPFFQRFFGRNFSFGVPQQRQKVENSLGSGVIVSEDGYIVTNAHVIKGATEITAVLSDGREFKAEKILAEDKTDLAVLKIADNDTRFAFMELADSDAIEVGDIVLAIGNPFGVGQTVTSGIVSGVARTTVGISDYSFFIQTDAAINPGNSGGALIGLDGQMIGLNTAIYSRDGGSMGIGFAIPANMVKTVIAAAKNGGVIRRPWFGAQMQPVTQDVAESLDLDVPAGVLVVDVLDDSPADKAGLKRGDVITKIGEHVVQDPQALKFRIATLEIGGAAPLTYLRDGKLREGTYKAVLAPDAPPREETPLKGRHPLDGTVVMNINPAVADELDLPFEAEGVVVKEVAANGYAAQLGIEPHDIVTMVNGDSVGNVKELARILERGNRGGWMIQINQRGRLKTLTVR